MDHLASTNICSSQERAKLQGEHKHAHTQKAELEIGTLSLL